MALTVETGAGVAGADSYAARATILAYWTARPHDPLAATVAAADVDDLDGAARESTTYIDALWGPYYRGERAGYVQGLLHPRVNAKDEAGYPLPALPPELVTATCELTARALSARLQKDVAMGERLKSVEKGIGPLKKRLEYFDNGIAAPQTSYGVVARILAPILNGSQPDAPNANWNWA